MIAKTIITVLSTVTILSAQSQIIKSYELNPTQYKKFKQALDNGFIDKKILAHEKIRQTKTIYIQEKKEPTTKSHTQKHSYNYYASKIKQHKTIKELQLNNLNSLFKLFQQSYTTNTLNLYKTQIVNNIQKILLSRTDLNANAIFDALNNINRNTKENTQNLNMLIREVH